jgi:hypothetical protein
MCRGGSNFFFAVPLQPDGMGDVIEFRAADLVQPLSPGRQLFIDLESFFGHGIVRFTRPADEGEIRAGGHALVAVGIQSESEHERGFFLLWLMRHALTLPLRRAASKRKKRRPGYRRIEVWIIGAAAALVIVEVKWWEIVRSRYVAREMICPSVKGPPWAAANPGIML